MSISSHRLVSVSENVPSPSVRFADLRVSDAEERKAILGAMETILDHGRLINGPEVTALETRLALYAERRFAVGVASGTEALVLALRAFGIGPGDEVVTTVVSWVATANAIHLVGAEPVFADVRDDYNIDPDSVRRMISRRTKAVMPVHYAGRPYDGAAVDAIAREHGIYHIEDGSQAFGGVSGERPVGRWGHVACCSANPMKLMAALGEAGFILCDDESVRDRFFRMRYNGVVPGDLLCREPSSNARMDTVQAAMLLIRLDRLAGAVAWRAALAERYTAGLREIGRCPPPPDGVAVHFLFPVRFSRDRDDLVEHLAACGIEARTRATDLLTLHPPFQACRGEWSNADRLMKETVFLPIHGNMAEKDVDRVVEAVIDFHKRTSPCVP